MLQSELSSLEAELADPSNPLLNEDHLGDRIDPGELMRGLVDVRGRLEKVKKGKEGRGRLVEVVLGQETKKPLSGETEPPLDHETTQPKDELDGTEIAEMDRRVGELEALVGSSSTILDEVNS